MEEEWRLKRQLGETLVQNGQVECACPCTCALQVCLIVVEHTPVAEAIMPHRA